MTKKYFSKWFGILFLCVLLVSCSGLMNLDNDWELVYKSDKPDEELGEIVLVPNGNGLFLSGIRPWFYYFPTRSFDRPGIKVLFDAYIYAHKICITDRVWIIADGGLFTYSTDQGQLEVYPDTEIYGEIGGCSKGSTNNILLWGKGWWAAYEGKWEYGGVKDFDIDYLVQDSDGTLWLLSRRGEIYHRSNGEWVLFGDQLGGKKVNRLFITDRKLWVHSTDGLYAWAMDDAQPELVIPFDEKELDLVEAVQQDHLGNIWVLSRRAVWQITEDRILEVKPPQDGDILLRGIAFDDNNDVIYAVTEKAIYTLNIQEFTERHDSK